ncbi:MULTISPECIES: class I SAM-dependent methyltransferase [Streptomyces]|uniref:Class I SAM-dependent methyltransferase n=1 Tax=Streptomyces kasugaensis TaxID=1946 RepID=A0A4Q9HNF5_STRKA|nr:class I SAM-dependent methyltransferase [Streptomyces kasugaensis]TBO55560.1 class I SAM-dependent methyltransferase [Streptomyces kasugaensis]WSK14766.1 methyltransferase domain-containing protein [Streptomyces celluloflavus]
MPMNLLHRWICNSAKWSATVEQQLLPWALDGVEFGTDVLEIGPGFGATTRVLVRRAPRLSVVEIDRDSAQRLHRTYGDSVEVVHADATAMPLPEQSFDTVVCFTMLHHVPTIEAQDRLLAEAFRVLRPGGQFAGCDSLTSRRFRMLHIGDICVTVPPESMAERLRKAGFDVQEVSVGRAGRSFRFRAVRP